MATIADGNNSYCTKADADTYFAARLHSTVWSDADIGDQNIALVMSTRLIDTSFIFEGGPVTIGQLKQWPRLGLFGPTGEVVDYTIPTLLKEATAELAMDLLGTDRTLDSDSDNLASLSLGSVSLNFKDKQTTRKPIPDRVVEMLHLWGRLKGQVAQSSGGLVKLVRS
jgi:hypothetical protein